MKKVAIIIPTYNEAKNIKKVIDLIYEKTKALKSYGIYVIVVDDNSPDNTWQIVKSISKLNKKVKLLLKKNKEGLGKAYIKGFNYVFKDLGADVVIQMDADLSHDPKEIPLMLHFLEKGYDLVIGSRYVPGGRILNWDFIRRITSRGGNFFARIVAGLYKVNDCTSGFRAFKTDILKKIDFNKVNVQGYAFLTSLLFEVYKKKAKIKEIPITFLDRQHGESKLNRREMFEFFINCLRLRFRI